MHQTIYLIVLSFIFHHFPAHANIIKRAKSKLGLKKKCQTNQAKIQICTKDLVLHGDDSIGRVKKIFTNPQDKTDSDLVVKLQTGKKVRLNINEVSKVTKKSCHTIQTPNHPMVEEKTFCKQDLVYSSLDTPSEIGKIQSIYYVLHDKNETKSSSDVLGIVSWKKGEKSLQDMSKLEASVLKSPTKDLFAGQVALYNTNSDLSVGKIEAIFSNGLALTKPYMQDLENKIILDTKDLSGSIDCINGIRKQDQIMIANSPELQVMHAFDNGTILANSKKKYKDLLFIDTNQEEIHSASLIEEECSPTPKIKKNLLKKLFKKISSISLKKILKRDAREPLDDEMN